jgi:hypothetical protein
LGLLEKLNGNSKDLIEYLNIKDDKMLWSKDEDEILKNLKSKDDFALKLLINYKGLESLKKRIKFMNFEGRLLQHIEEYEKESNKLSLIAINEKKEILNGARLSKVQIINPKNINYKNYSNSLIFSIKKNSAE